jgi:hypothetical protein
MLRANASSWSRDTARIQRVSECAGPLNFAACLSAVFSTALAAVPHARPDWDVHDTVVSNRISDLRLRKTGIS